MKRLHWLDMARNFRARFSTCFIPVFKVISVMAIAIFLPAAFATIRGSQQARVTASTVGAHAQTIEDHTVNIPYFTESGGMASTLTLNNNLPEDSEVRVTIFGRKGEPFTPPPITLPANRVERVSLRSLIEGAKGDFDSGSVQVSYRGPSMAVTSQVSINSEHGRLSFESSETSMMDYSSSQLDVIVWAPDRDTRTSAALTNTTADELSVTVARSQPQDARSSDITLGPHETCVINLNASLSVKKTAASASLVSFEHNGAPGALIATGFAVNERTGFSCNLPLVDRSTAKISRLSGAHVRFGLADGREGFPKGTSFLAPLVVANATDAPHQARVYVDYTDGPVPKRVDLGQMNLAPREVKQVDLSKELARRGVRSSGQDAGVDIEYSGQPGAVIARLTSLDSTGDYSFDVPVKDPQAGSMRGSGSYPWRLDQGHTTVLHLKNTIDRAVFALVQVRYDGGSYNLERMKLEPYQAAAIDIGQLRDAQQQDIRDSVMPKDVETGQVVWFEEEVGSLIGRAEVADIEAGIAGSFSCPGACQCPPSFNTSYMTPSSSAGMMGGTAQFRANEMRRDCMGVNYGPYNRTADSTWTSDNTSVMTVSVGTASCLSPGTATIRAQFQATVYGLNCFQNFINPATTGTATVFRLQVIVPDSTIHYDDGTNAATIVAGETFGLTVHAVDNNGNIMSSVNASVGVSAGRTLGSNESGLPSTINLVNGTYINGSMLLNRVNGTERGTSFRFSNGGTSLDFNLYTYFRVTMDAERWKNCDFTGCPSLGSYFCQTACGAGLSQPTAFISLTSTGLCNRAVKVGNPSNATVQSTTVRDVGPRTSDPYWNTGSIPVFNPNNRAGTLGGCVSDVLMNNLGISNGCSPGPFGEGVVVWRFD